MLSSSLRAASALFFVAALTTPAQAEPREAQPPAPPLSLDEPVPLRLVAPNRAAPQLSSPALPGRRADHRRLLHNVADRPIAAWHFACVHGLADGRTAWVGQGADAFPGSAGAAAGGSDSSLLLEPGEGELVEVPEPPLRESPFEVWSCGPTAAIFADGGTWGSPEILDGLFARRLDETREAIRLLRALERLGETATYRRLATEEVDSALGAALPEGSWGRYRGEVAAATRAATPRESSEALERLEADVRADLTLMLEQLRPQDLRQLPLDEAR